MQKRKDPIILILCLVSVITLSLTVGFAAFNASLDISSSSALLVQTSDIRVSGITASSSTSSGVSYYELYTDNNVYTSVSLPNSDSTVTYNVKITNIGNVEAALDSITGLQSNLEITLNNYQLNDMLCDDTDNTKCKLGSTSTISMTIGYKQNGYNSNNTSYTIALDFNFIYATNSVARIGDTLYETLALAVEDVPYTDTQTTVVLLKNTSELIEVDEHQNVLLDLNGKTLSNNGVANVMINDGTLTIANGTIFTDVEQGAINNESTGVLTMSSGSIIVDAGRQAIYNNKGTATISGTAYLYSTSTTRATIQNLAGSTLNITGGTIIATSFNSAVLNAGTLTVGVKDGTSNKTTPVIQGMTYGIENTAAIKFYDGIAKGKSRGVKNDNLVSEIETDNIIFTSTEVIGTETFKTWYTALYYTVTFAPTGGSLASGESSRRVERGAPIGDLPTPTRNGYEFNGWFTSNNQQINSNTIINSDITFTAHWTKTNDVARIGNNTYDSLQNAVNAAGSSQTTIELLKNSKEQVTIPVGKNIILDLGDSILSNNGNKSVIECKGTLTLINGKIDTKSNSGAAINVVSGSFTMSGGSIIAGARQAVYITGGTATISGTAYLKSATDGAYNNMERATVQNVSGSLIITGGTIEATKQHAVASATTLTIGTKDGSINTTTPVIIGEINGVGNTGTFNFYDGIIKGKTNAIDGTVDDKEVSSQIVDGTDGAYKTAYLEIP